MTDNTRYEPAVLVKIGTPLVQPHEHKNHLPSVGTGSDLVDGSVYRCSCEDHFRYFEDKVDYGENCDYLLDDRHWARCDRDGFLFRMMNVAPWWKKIFGINDWRWEVDR